VREFLVRAVDDRFEQIAISGSHRANVRTFTIRRDNEKGSRGLSRLVIRAAPCLPSPYLGEIVAAIWVSIDTWL
jgi:hypothetical protein